MRWSLKKGSWDKFQSACDEFILEPDTNSTCESMYNSFISQLVHAIDASFPKTGKRNNPKKIPTAW